MIKYAYNKLHRRPISYNGCYSLYKVMPALIIIFIDANSD